MKRIRVPPDAGNREPMSVEIDLRINGADVPVMLDEEALRRIASALPHHGTRPGPEAPSPYMTITEAAEYLRCSRQRIDDLLSSKRLSRHKEGRRTLVARDEIEKHLRREPQRRG